MDASEQVFKALCVCLIWSFIAMVISAFMGTIATAGKISQTACDISNNVIFWVLFISCIITFIQFRPK